MLEVAIERYRNKGNKNKSKVKNWKLGYNFGRASARKFEIKTLSLLHSNFWYL